MADGTRHPGRADDRGRHDHGERGPALIPAALDERFPGGEWLDPAAAAITRAMQLLDQAKVVLVAAAGAVLLLYVGAKIERYQLKSRLAVLDGAAAGVDVDVSEERPR